MITCAVCGYDKNPDGSEFCDACGAELSTTTAIEDTVTPEEPPVDREPPISPTPQPEEPSVPSTPITQPTTPITQTAPATAKLVAKQPNAPIPEFSIEGSALIGIFDPDMGPVDIDLEDFSGNETVSRNHAEIYQEAGIWKIKDLGSTNGVFIKPMGQTRFGARITTPESLNSGDEIAIAKIRFLFQNS